KYTYNALPSKGDHIRLIKLYPGEFRDRIEIEIKTVEFDRFDTPPYFALSYTWNDSHHDRLVVEGKRISMENPMRLEYDFRHPVWCGDRRLLVSTNLRDALRRLRHPTQPQTFWINALCINQDDLDERASQVLIIQRIYHKATMVKMWLSEAGDDCEEGFKLIRRL
ncbi:heterokaryon incompatibility protein-domain-containing protein, partial [Pyrenochaeta sp. MPI-SDFR-AT-0127]